MLRGAYRHTEKLYSKGCAKYGTRFGSSVHYSESSPQRCPDIFHSLKILIQRESCTRDVHKSLLIRNPFCGNQHNESRTLLRGVSEFLSYFPHLLPDWGEIWYKRSKYSIVGHSFHKNRRREDCNLLLGVN
jgi:hypothetical protein